MVLRLSQTSQPREPHLMIVRLLAAAALACGLLAAPHPAAAQADLALVIAVDVSSSIDDKRFQLQREGIAAGLESPDVVQAVASGARGTIELAIVEWSEEQTVLVDWTVIHGAADLRAVAEALRQKPRPQVGWRTDVAGGMSKSVAMFDSVPLVADRRVVDVSGDGQQNCGKIAAALVRDAATAQDITINGLPITSGDEPDVDHWYKDHVVGGAGHFMVVANGHNQFSDAMRMKLAAEVAGLMPPISLAQAR
jgi:hypothetical protein